MFNYNDIIVVILTNNLQKLKLLLNKNNVNNVIDNKNNYTALHYAVVLPNDNITKFILELGADPKIKQNEGYDAFELSLRSGKKFIFKYFEEQQQIKIDKLKTDNIKLETDNIKLKTDNIKLALNIGKLKTDNLNLETDNLKLGVKIDDYKIINDSLHKVIDSKDNEINRFKRDLDESEKAFTNLLKKNKK